MARTPTRRPPMGWNSWDCFGTTVTEAEVLTNAEILAARLLPLGWDTVVVDIDWSDPTARSHGYNAGAPLGLCTPPPVARAMPRAPAVGATVARVMSGTTAGGGTAPIPLPAVSAPSRVCS